MRKLKKRARKIARVAEKQVFLSVWQGWQFKKMCYKKIKNKKFKKEGGGYDR